jgi:hypothetical protein
MTHESDRCLYRGNRLACLKQSVGSIRTAFRHSQRLKWIPGSSAFCPELQSWMAGRRPTHIRSGKGDQIRRDAVSIAFDVHLDAVGVATNVPLRPSRRLKQRLTTRRRPVRWRDAER